MGKINASPEEQENVVRVCDQLLAAIEEDNIVIIPTPNRKTGNADMILMSAPEIDDEGDIKMQVFARLFMNSQEAYSQYLIPNTLSMDESEGLIYDSELDEYLKESEEDE